jgi:putative pyruvate formate lyase activating enzyme
MRLEPALLRERAGLLERLQSPCRLCPRACGADRAAGEAGFCEATATPMVASYGPHFGEERELVGGRGSGTIFFSHCNLGCSFCQNFDISHEGRGREAAPSSIAYMMLELQALGCANVNLVTPTHYAPQAVSALAVAREQGLTLPLVYNCGGYESIETLRILEGVVDVYMPDAKFADPDAALDLCGAADYPEVMLASLVEMERQVGDLEVDGHGLATRGLLIRHLVMPENMAATDRLLELIACRVSPRAAVNVMAQYRPCGRAVGASGPVGRTLRAAEHRAAVEHARRLGLRVLDSR